MGECPLPPLGLVWQQRGRRESWMWESISIIRTETQTGFLPEEAPVSDGEPMKEAGTRRSPVGPSRAEISIGDRKRQKISGPTRAHCRPSKIYSNPLFRDARYLSLVRRALEALVKSRTRRGRERGGEGISRREAAALGGSSRSPSVSSPRLEYLLIPKSVPAERSFPLSRTRQSQGRFRRGLSNRNRL
jgi:hypothetical protein